MEDACEPCTQKQHRADILFHNLKRFYKHQWVSYYQLLMSLKKLFNREKLHMLSKEDATLITS